MLHLIMRRVRSSATVTRRLSRSLAAFGGAALLVGCSSIGGIGTAPTPEAPIGAPVPPVASQPLGATTPTPTENASTIGSGPVRIALIVPLTQGNGQAAAVGVSLRNAAELGIADFESAIGGQGPITLLVKDDQSTPAGARAATQAAIAEGAELILGPLFAPNVREAASVARPANKQIIAFSTDTSVAARGVYLLSFLVESYVNRIVDFAASRGKKSFAALIPNSDYGRIAEAEFQSVAARRGVRVMAIEHYNPGGAAAAVQKLAGVAAEIDALFIPDQADAMASIAQALTANNLDSRRVQILGTGVWADARVLRIPALQGAWFAAPENTGFNSFATKYRARFKSDPTRIATLAYDTAQLAAALARQQGGQRFAESVLTNAAGFNGADGVFRFRADGQNERGLSVLQIGSGSSTVVSPAPKSFGGPGGT